MKRGDILGKASEYVDGPRADDYGDAFENFERIAEGWNIILKNALNTHGYFTASHVALMMDWVKTARLLHNLESADGWIDKCGYSALGGECAMKSRERSDYAKSLIENAARPRKADDPENV